MTINCYICHKPFREEDEVVFTGLAYWHELASRVHYSISKPHEVFKSTMHHMKCEDNE